jgi:NAD(P)H-dependent flavin oxidoreductase YrpB (nitropropane dioxygenase family)
MSDIFDSKYPILCAPMNKVSDLNLAIKLHYCGIFPSISIFNYYDIIHHNINYIKLENDLKDFRNTTGDSKILLSTNNIFIEDIEFQNLCKKKYFSHLEIILEKKINYELLKNLKKNKIILLVKIWSHEQISYEMEEIFNGFILKGPDGAGSIPIDNLTLEQRLIDIKRKKSNLKIICSGGIYNGKQIKKLLSTGADSVAIGTLFAMSEESCISNESKIKILESNSNMLSSVSELKQNAIIFSKIESPYDNDTNNTFSLKTGIKNSNQGHLFVGKSIDFIYKILPIKIIVNNLVNDLI